ncbi:helix-turn-helix domain-containing protein [Virgibacillus profundi]|uniref:helix-turn-helix domain-containing protein n=1 Tax=Virgibacillus profundi TaxID=2024555 RepID=UPI0023E853B8|nr:helix-turn-helix transcriptional regulator [Virgibacillus profundi]
MLEERNLMTVDLQMKANLSGNITTRMRRNEYITLESIDKICRTLCRHVNDILDFELESIYK